MKKFYSEPKAKIIEISNADIIATSYGDPIDPKGEGEQFDEGGE